MARRVLVAYTSTLYDFKCFQAQLNGLDAVTLPVTCRHYQTLGLLIVAHVVDTVVHRKPLLCNLGNRAENSDNNITILNAYVEELTHVLTILLLPLQRLGELAFTLYSVFVTLLSFEQPVVCAPSASLRAS